MDALSQALAAVRFTSATFYRLRCRAPWGFSVPASSAAGPAFASPDTRLLHFHLVTAGRADVRVDGRDAVVSAGDVIVFPQGQAHEVRGGGPATIAESRAPIDELRSGRPSSITIGGTGDETRIICGFFACPPPAERLYLDGLPSPFVVRHDPDGWVVRSVEHLASEAEEEAPGAAALLSKMADALFVETLRRHAFQQRDHAVGWMAAARDPVVGRVIAAIHATPARKWTNDALAAEAHTSTTVLLERFARFLGVPPAAYVTRWRLCAAAGALEASSKSVVEVAAEVGYDSESAFNRAFKREFGLPPRRYANRVRAG